MNRADRAVEEFFSGYSCAQVVFMAFAEEHGLSRADAARIATLKAAGAV